MSAPQELYHRVTRQGWWRSFPFILALLVLVFMVWTTAKQITYPNDGIASIRPDGQIVGLEPNGPAAGKLFEGDRIISIDGKDWGATITNYPGKHGGDAVTYLVSRDGEQIQVTTILEAASVTDILLYMAPILVGLIFWGIGIGVQSFKPADASANVFYAWCLASATTLTAGVASYLGPGWTSNLFNLLLCLIGPLSVHFHLFFPQVWPLKGRKLALWVLYGIGGLGALPYIVLGVDRMRAFPWYALFSDGVRFYLGLNLLVVFGLLTYNYFKPQKPGVRGKARLVALGGGLSALLIVTLTIIPDALFSQPLVPFDFAFMLLGLLPLTYGYAIFRLHVIEIDRNVNRGATYLLVYSILGSIYLMLYALIQRIKLPGLENTQVVDTFLILLLVTLFVPLRSAVQKLIDRVFYGGWYDYRLGLTQITQGLEQAATLEALAKMVSERLVNTLRLQETCVFLRDVEGDFSIIHAAFPPGSVNPPVVAYPILPRSSLTYLLKVGAIERISLLESLSEANISSEELQLLQSEQINLWVPVVGRGQILGLLALGPKIGGDVFSGDDLDILRVAAREIGPIIENLHLVAHLRNHAAELEQRVQERTSELFNAKEWVETILASVGEGVVVIDLDGKVSTVNTAFEIQTGYSETEIAGLNLQDLFFDNRGGEWITEIEAALLQGEVWSGEVLGRRKLGDTYDVQLTISPIRDQSGSTVGYVSSQRDITRQKELERMKDMFIADVSHELRTPTTNISLYLDLLQSAPRDKWPQYMRVVKDQSQQLAKLVDDILDLSRLARARSLTSEFISLDLNALIDKVITANQPLANTSGIKLTFSPSETSPFVNGEQNQLARMITNLVTNGLRYTSKGEVCVRTIMDGDHVYIEVMDTGIGIEKEDLSHIFERFYRGSNVRQSKISGTGLGLAIVKEIADLHRGTIEVKSELNKGSVFRVKLPAGI
jgi:two-component system NtrC family sensor kinase